MKYGMKKQDGKIFWLYRHSSFNGVLLYRGILSNVVFLNSKTALFYYLTRFFHGWNQKKSFFKDFFPKKIHFFFRFLPTFLLLLLFPIIFSQKLRVKGNSCFQKKISTIVTKIKKKIKIHEKVDFEH